MRALLNKLLISFNSDDPQLLAGWHKLFDLEIEAAESLPAGAVADVQLSAVVVSAPLPPPAVRPIYSEQPAGHLQRTVRYYATENGGVLDLARPAQIVFNFDERLAAVALTRQNLDTGNLEDITMIALAPFLRRSGYFMVHAFAAARDSAVLLCGPSGSGKTTTGLLLLQAGWRYLANDVTLLRQDQETVNAYPSPGAINLHPHTLSILPAYQERLKLPPELETSGKYVLARGSLRAYSQYGTQTAVAAILFPALATQEKYALHPVPPAIALARLIEDSVDQWDQETYEQHIDVLTLLSGQARAYDLRLPTAENNDLGELGDQLAALQTAPGTLT